MILNMINYKKFSHTIKEDIVELTNWEDQFTLNKLDMLTQTRFGPSVMKIIFGLATFKVMKYSSNNI